MKKKKKIFLGFRGFSASFFSNFFSIFFHFFSFFSHFLKRKQFSQFFLLNHTKNEKNSFSSSYFAFSLFYCAAPRILKVLTSIFFKTATKSIKRNIPCNPVITGMKVKYNVWVGGILLIRKKPMENIFFDKIAKIFILSKKIFFPSIHPKINFALSTVESLHLNISREKNNAFRLWRSSPSRVRTVWL